MPGSVWNRVVGRSPVSAVVRNGSVWARPKSRIFTRPSLVTMTFSGFRSRWTTARACAAGPSMVLSSHLLILTNGKVWTGDGFAEGLAIEGNRIVAVGAAASGIDLRGRLVVPGFIDNHTHFIDGGMQLSRVQLRDAATPEELARRIAEHKAPWVTGGGWDHTL